MSLRCIVDVSLRCVVEVLQSPHMHHPPPLLHKQQPVDAEAEKKEKAMKEFAEILAKAKEEAAKEEAAEEGAKEATTTADEVVPEVVPAGTPEVSDAGASVDQVVEAEASTVDEADTKAEPAEEAEDKEVKPASLAKAEAAAASRAGGEEVAGKKMRSQKVVNLATEVDIRERTDIYRNFLLYCMSGDVVNLPMGSQVCCGGQWWWWWIWWCLIDVTMYSPTKQVVIERDESEFARLSQLGDILGLTPFDVSGVLLCAVVFVFLQQDLCCKPRDGEQAFLSSPLAHLHSLTTQLQQQVCIRVWQSRHSGIRHRRCSQTVC